MTEKEYRALDIDSYSSISQFLNDRKKYYRKFVLKENLEEDDIQSFRMGSLVDTLALPDENGNTNFSEKFIVSTVKDIPTGQMLQFCQELYKKTCNDKNFKKYQSYKSGDFVGEVLNYGRFYKDAYDIVGFKRDALTNIVKKFQDNYIPYFYELLQSAERTLIDSTEESKAKRTVNELMKSPFTGPIMSLQSNERYTVINQLIVIFIYNKYPLKCMIDKVIIDHEKKTISPYDLKTTYSVDDFNVNYYKYKYYLQAAVYWNGLRKWADEQGYLSKGYTVDFMQFIVCDSGSYMQPLIYTTDMEHHAEGLGGFYSEDGRFYPGLNQAIDDMEWHKNNNIWNISRDNFVNKGRVKISLGGRI